MKHVLSTHNCSTAPTHTHAHIHHYVLMEVVYRIGLVKQKSFEIFPERRKKVVNSMSLQCWMWRLSILDFYYWILWYKRDGRLKQRGVGVKWRRLAEVLKDIALQFEKRYGNRNRFVLYSICFYLLNINISSTSLSLSLHTHTYYSLTRTISSLSLSCRTHIHRANHSFEQRAYFPLSKY